MRHITQSLGIIALIIWHYCREGQARAAGKMDVAYDLTKI
jgi:hypothetical protein